MRIPGIVLLVGALARPLHAQPRVEPRELRFWVAAAALLSATAASDAPLSANATRNPRTIVTRIADELEPAGRRRFAVPALAGAWIATRVAGRTRASRAVVRVAAGYLAADLLVSSLKTAVGRHRPDTLGGGAWRFRSMSGDAQWHAMPSGHAGHVFALAAGVSDEVRRPAASVAAYAVAALVGWQRIASRSHWPSDVVVGGVLGIAAARTTGRWMRNRSLRDSRPGESASRLSGVRVALLPGAFAVSLPIQGLTR